MEGNGKTSSDLQPAMFLHGQVDDQKCVPNIKAENVGIFRHSQLNKFTDMPFYAIAQARVYQWVTDMLSFIPHQLCQFHFLREAARPIYEADRHAKVLLKKNLRTSSARG